MKKHKNSWKTLSTRIAHKNPWFYVSEHKVIRPGGQKGKYFVVRNNPAVFIVPVTEKLETYLVGLWRYPTGKFSWEIPAGGSDKQKPLVAAKRELQEETGLQAKHWKQIGTFQSFNGISDEISHTFLATGLSSTALHAQKEEGIVEVKKMPIKKVMQLIKAGKITDGQTIAAITQAALYLKIINF